MAKKKTREQHLADLVTEATKIAKEFESCQQWKASKDILRQAKRSVAYYEGDQWSEQNRKAPFEKPIMNIVQNMIDAKVASILSKNFKINYVIDNDMVSTDNVTKFADFQTKEMGQRGLNRDAALDGLLKGTWIWYFHWDEDCIGQMGIKEGGINAMSIDVKDIAVANPKERNEQKQEYIILRSREKVKRVKDMAKDFSEEEKKRFFVDRAFDGAYDTDPTAADLDSVTVYTKFFRQDGEVYFTKSTKEIVFQEATSLNPMTNVEILRNKRKEENEKTDESMYEIEAPNNALFEIPNDLTMQEAMRRKFKASVYPFVFGRFYQRDKSIFGVSWANQLIANQRIINNLITTNYISATKNAMPTIVAKEGALMGQKLDMSKPNNVVIDRTEGGIDGIKVLNTGTIPSAHFELAQSTVSLVKDTYRASEVLDDGRNIASNASGTAISQLLSIQEKPVQQWQEELVDAIEKEGRVLEMFYKLYYQDKRFSASYDDAEIMQQKQNNMNAPITERVDASTFTTSQYSVFNGMDYLETPFNVSVEVGEGGKFSEIANQQFLDTLFQNGIISKLSPEDLLMYVESTSDTFFPRKRQFKMLIEQKQQSMITQLQQQVAQLQNALSMSSAQNDAMKQEFTNKVNLYNQQIKQAEQMLKAQKPKEGDK